MADDVGESYRSSLSDLKFNSKPMINMLTMLAEEEEQNAHQIVQAIEQHIDQVLCFISFTFHHNTLLKFVE